MVNNIQTKKKYFINKLTLFIKDPKSLFEIEPNTYSCQNSTCSQKIKFIKPFGQLTTYSMNVLFTQQLRNIIYIANATIYVIIQRPKLALTPPKFAHSSYQFWINENLPSNSIARNVRIVIYETDELSLYTSGFTIELLNKDLTSARDMFTLTPSYGEGTLIASLKLNSNSMLDYENGKKEYDYLVNI